MIRAFVSSTYRDLKEHRAYVIDRLVKGGIFVDPMERWTAASDEPKELSQDRVKDCDLCILLVGFRRGHIAEDETLSITQLEYREALRREIDVLVFMAQEDADWPAESMAEMKSDPELKRWRDELREHFVISPFTPSPESVNVDSAILRWFEKKGEPSSRISTPTTEDEFPLEIRAYSNLETTLVAWRSEQPIAGCLGFALYRRVLGTASVTEELVKTRLGFSSNPAGSRVSSATQPIQNFRWTDRLMPGQEVRYRVVPVLGRPEELHQAADVYAGSGWTRWVSCQTNQTPGYQAIFNRVSVASQQMARRFENLSRGTQDELRHLRYPQSPLRAPLGGELRNTLLRLLAAAKRLDQRVYAALSDLDDIELIEALKVLGPNLHLILGSQVEGTDPEVRERKAKHNAKIHRELKNASVHVHGLLLAGRHHFAVFCDRWGTPNRVWTGSMAWTTDALYLRSNHALLIESVALARAYLDRWDFLRDSSSEIPHKRNLAASRPEQIYLNETSITLWNTPATGNADLRDLSRVIRGAREGILFLMSGRKSLAPLLEEILHLGEEDLFVQGLSSFSSRKSITLHDSRLQLRHEVQAKTRMDSNMVVVDPFGPHPVVITASHDFGLKTSSKEANDLLIIEGATGLAAECAVYIIGLYDHYRWRALVSQMATRGRTASFLLKADDQWQQSYFEKVKRSEFNFLFGSLWPGL